MESKIHRLIDTPPPNLATNLEQINLDPIFQTEQLDRPPPPLILSTSRASRTTTSDGGRDRQWNQSSNTSTDYGRRTEGETVVGSAPTFSQLAQLPSYNPPPDFDPFQLASSYSRPSHIRTGSGGSSLQGYQVHEFDMLHRMPPSPSESDAPFPPPTKSHRSSRSPSAISPTKEISINLQNQVRRRGSTGGGYPQIYVRGKSPLVGDRPRSRQGVQAGGNVRRSTEEVRDTTRRARIESEQRRRDEQKDGFDALRAVLPPSNQRPSKTLTLDRTIEFIGSLQAAHRQLQTAHDELAVECQRLRQINYNLVQTQAAREGVPVASIAGFRFEDDLSR